MIKRAMFCCCLLLLNLCSIAQDVTSEITNPTFASGCSNGSIDITMSGGFPPYEFEWSNGATTEDVSNLPEGDYSVVITDVACGTVQLEFELKCECGNDCFIVAEPVHARCGSGGAILDADLICPGGEGALPYTLKWRDLKPHYEQPTNRYELDPGTYCLEITDANDCVYEECWVIEDIQTVIDVDLVEVVNIPVCRGNTVEAQNTWRCTGSITIKTNGEIEWSSNISNPNQVNSPTITELCAGFYTVTITKQGCTVTRTFEVKCCRRTDNGGDVLDEIEAFSLEHSILFASTTETSDGAIYLRVLVGNIYPDLNGYVFTWTLPDGSIRYGPSLEDVPVGEYCVHVSDGCTEIEKTCFIIESCEEASIEIEAINIEPTCEGGASGKIEVRATGANDDVPGGFRFDWDNDEDDEFKHSKSSRFCMPAGTHCVTAMDPVGCRATRCFEIPVGQVLRIEESNVINTCSGKSVGSIDVTDVTGGLRPYQYAWSHSSESSPMVSGLGPGTYYVTITEDCGCSEVFEFNIINEETEFDVSPTILHTCPGYAFGKITLDISNGNYPLSQVVWSDGGVGLIRDLLGTGTYYADIMDDRGCSMTVGPFVITDQQSFVEEDQTNRDDCIVEYYCNEHVAYTDDLGDESYYDPADCEYIIHECGDGEPFYPSGPGSDREPTALIPDPDPENCRTDYYCTDPQQQFHHSENWPVQYMIFTNFEDAEDIIELLSNNEQLFCCNLEVCSDGFDYYILLGSYREDRLFIGNIGGCDAGLDSVTVEISCGSGVGGGNGITLRVACSDIIGSHMDCYDVDNNDINTLTSGEEEKLVTNDTDVKEIPRKIGISDDGIDILFVETPNTNKQVNKTRTVITENNKSFAVFPNPVSDILNIVPSSFRSNTEMFIEIYSIEGSLIKRELYNFEENRVWTSNVGDLLNGQLSFLRILDKDGQVIQEEKLLLP